MQGISAKHKFFGLPSSKFLLPVYRVWILSFFPYDCVIFVPQCLSAQRNCTSEQECHCSTSCKQPNKLTAVTAGMQGSPSIPALHVCIWEQCYGETIARQPVSSNFIKGDWLVSHSVTESASIPHPPIQPLLPHPSQADLGAFIHGKEAKCATDKKCS